MSIFIILLSLTVAITFSFLRRLPKVRAAAWFLASLGFAYGIGLSGLLPRLLRDGGAVLVGVQDKLETLAFGVALPLCLVVGLGIVFIHDMMPKHAAKLRTSIIAVLLPPLMLAAGGSAAQLATTITSNINTVSMTSQGG